MPPEKKKTEEINAILNGGCEKSKRMLRLAMEAYKSTKNSKATIIKWNHCAYGPSFDFKRTWISLVSHHYNMLWPQKYVQ